MYKITKDLIHLTTTITSHDIPPEIIDIGTLENNVNNLQALLLAQIKAIEIADIKQCLFMWTVWETTGRQCSMPTLADLV